MPTTCYVVNCSSRADRDQVNFYKLPSELHFPHRTELNELSKRRRQRWIEAVKRSDLTEIKLKYIRVCSKHFLTGKPSALTDQDNLDWVPSVLMDYGSNEEILRQTQITAARQEKAKKMTENQIEPNWQVTDLKSDFP